MEIRTGCPSRCKYICGDKCVARECYKCGNGSIIIPEVGFSVTITPEDLYKDMNMYVSCLVCNESIKIPKGQESLGKVAICDKCKSAILKLRKMLEGQDGDN